MRKVKFLRDNEAPDATILFKDLIPPEDLFSSQTVGCGIKQITYRTTASDNYVPYGVLVGSINGEYVPELVQCGALFVLIYHKKIVG